MRFMSSLTLKAQDHAKCLALIVYKMVSVFDIDSSRDCFWFDIDSKVRLSCTG